MRKITVRGSKFSEGFHFGSIFITEGGNFVDETRNTVFQVLRRLKNYIWLWDDKTPLSWDDGTEIPIR